VFIITGGASGIGGACATLFVSRGGKVAILDMNEELGKAKVAELGSDNALFVIADVSSEDDVRNAIDRTVEKFGAIHGAINCAGIGLPQKVWSQKGVHPLQRFEFILRVNLVGTFNVIRLVTERIAKQNAVNEDGERGVFVQIASVAAFDGQIGQAAYSASKAGVVGMTLPIARELAALGIRVCTIAPGLVKTPLLAGLPEKAAVSLGKQVPFPKRLGDPMEIALSCLHVIENSYLNGETIRVDGGIRMAAQ